MWVGCVWRYAPSPSDTFALFQIHRNSCLILLLLLLLLLVGGGGGGGALLLVFFFATNGETSALTHTFYLVTDPSHI